MLHLVADAPAAEPAPTAPEPIASEPITTRQAELLLTENAYAIAQAVERGQQHFLKARRNGVDPLRLRQVQLEMDAKLNAARSAAARATGGAAWPAKIELLKAAFAVEATMRALAERNEVPTHRQVMAKPVPVPMANATPHEVLAALAARGITLSIHNLADIAARGPVDDDAILLIRAHKAGLVGLLSSSGGTTII